MLTTIEDTRDKLLDVLKSLGPGWHTRAELAEAIHKNTLNPVDVAALDMLAGAGQIEKVNQQIRTTGRGANLTQIVYRVRG